MSIFQKKKHYVTLERSHVSVAYILSYPAIRCLSMVHFATQVLPALAPSRFYIQTQSFCPCLHSSEENLKVKTTPYNFICACCDKVMDGGRGGIIRPVGGATRGTSTTD